MSSARLYVVSPYMFVLVSLVYQIKQSDKSDSVALSHQILSLLSVCVCLKESAW